MDNDKFQEMVLDNFKELRGELREIMNEQKKTCIEIAEQKLHLENHLTCMNNKRLSNKEKKYLTLTIISVSIAVITLGYKLIL